MFGHRLGHALAVGSVHLHCDGDAVVGGQVELDRMLVEVVLDRLGRALGLDGLAAHLLDQRLVAETLYAKLLFVGARRVHLEPRAFLCDRHGSPLRVYPNSPLKKASLTGFHATAKHIAAKAVSPSSETMRTI